MIFTDTDNNRAKANNVWHTRPQIIDAASITWIGCDLLRETILNVSLMQQKITQYQRTKKYL